MMRTIVLCLALISLVAAQTTDVCQYKAIFKCAANNGPCAVFPQTDTTAKTVTTTECSGSQYCNITDAATFSGTCASRAALNGFCSAVAQCGSGLACSNSSCITISVVGDRQTCDIGGARVCPNTHFCGLSSNFSEGFICQAAIVVGGVCNTTFTCTAGSECNNGVCVAGYSLAEGASCTTAAGERDFFCGAGLACIAGKCIKGFSGSNKVCTVATSGTDCATNENCVSYCSGNDLKYRCEGIDGVSQSVVNNYNSLTTCLKANANDACVTTGTCIKCQSQACKVEEYAGFLGLKTRCNKDATCADIFATTSSAASVVASVLFVAVALLVAM